MTWERKIHISTPQPMGWKSKDSEAGKDWRQKEKGDAED